MMEATQLVSAHYGRPAWQNSDSEDSDRFEKGHYSWAIQETYPINWFSVSFKRGIVSGLRVGGSSPLSEPVRGEFFEKISARQKRAETWRNSLANTLWTTVEATPRPGSIQNGSYHSWLRTGTSEYLYFLEDGACQRFQGDLERTETLKDLGCDRWTIENDELSIVLRGDHLKFAAVFADDDSLVGDGWDRTGFGALRAWRAVRSDPTAMTQYIQERELLFAETRKKREEQDARMAIPRRELLTMYEPGESSWKEFVKDGWFESPAGYKYFGVVGVHGELSKEVRVELGEATKAKTLNINANSTAYGLSLQYLEAGIGVQHTGAYVDETEYVLKGHAASRSMLRAGPVPVNVENFVEVQCVLRFQARELVENACTEREH